MCKYYQTCHMFAPLTGHKLIQSGSLVALHQACRTLRADESTLALAGASQLLLTPDQSIAMS
jgi:hypothetical protein